MVVLCRDLCYFKIIFIANDYEVYQCIVIFQFYTWEPQITGYSFLQKYYFYEY